MSVLNKKVLDFAKRKIGSRVFAVIESSDGKQREKGLGECWDLAFEALRNAGAKTPHDFGKTYKWSNTIVSLNNAKPGDIIQYDAVSIKVTVVEDQGDQGSSSKWQTNEIGTPEHTAIIKEIGANGYVTVVEQNMNNRKTTRVNSYYLKNTSFTTGNTTTTVVLRGQFSIFRPEAKRQ